MVWNGWKHVGMYFQGLVGGFEIGWEVDCWWFDGRVGRGF